MNTYLIWIPHCSEFDGRPNFSDTLQSFCNPSFDEKEELMQSKRSGFWSSVVADSGKEAISRVLQSTLSADNLFAVCNELIALSPSKIRMLDPFL